MFIDIWASLLFIDIWVSEPYVYRKKERKKKYIFIDIWISEPYVYRYLG